MIATCAGPAPRRGREQGNITPVFDGAIAARNETISYIGRSDELAQHVDVSSSTIRIDARGCAVIPGLVDPHTHAVHAGDRRDELRGRLAGDTYEGVAARGGGILSTVDATRAAQEDQLVAEARVRLDEMLACGTTTCEIKSGYGLTTESELKQLRAIRTLARSHPIEITPTFLGAHEVPVEFRGRRDDYVSLVVNEMIPHVASERLAEWCDVFCERGVFTIDESVTILEAGVSAGLKPRVHADELGATGGSHVAARVGARSADHLVFVDEASADELARASVTAILLPIAAFYLKLGRFAPARMLIERGVPVALATDVNPGGGFSPSVPFAISLACFCMGMTLEEALIAATLNAAWSLDRADIVGSLEPGKQMDAVIIKGGLVELLRVGAPAVHAVIKKGKVVRSQ